MPTRSIPEQAVNGNFQLVGRHGLLDIVVDRRHWVALTARDHQYLRPGCAGKPSEQRRASSPFARAVNDQRGGVVIVKIRVGKIGADDSVAEA